MNVAVIPARGGSKRIPRKNIREFCGKPMIAWPIEVAKDSGLFDHIIVSTSIFGGTYYLIKGIVNDLGINVTYVDPTDTDLIKSSIQDKSVILIDYVLTSILLSASRASVRIYLSNFNHILDKINLNDTDISIDRFNSITQTLSNS